MDMLLALSKEEGISALIATHNTKLAHRMDRIINLKDGVVQDTV